MRLERFAQVIAIAVAGMLIACSEPTANKSDTASPEPPASLDPGMVWANPASCNANSPVTGLPAPQRDSLSRAPFATPDQIFYDIAMHVPGGFAGVYLQPVNGRNTLTVNLVDTSDVHLSLDSLGVYFPLYYGAHYSFARDSVVVRRVRWSWAHLYDWYRYTFLDIVFPNDLVSSHIGVVQNRIEFAGATYAARDTIAERLIALGVPCWLVAVDSMARPVPL